VEQGSGSVSFLGENLKTCCVVIKVKSFRNTKLHVGLYHPRFFLWFPVTSLN